LTAHFAIDPAQLHAGRIRAGIICSRRYPGQRGHPAVTSQGGELVFFDAAQDIADRFVKAGLYGSRIYGLVGAVSALVAVHLLDEGDAE
jgi:hypothetical protein